MCYEQGMRNVAIGLIALMMIGCGSSETEQATGTGAGAGTGSAPPTPAPIVDGCAPSAAASAREVAEDPSFELRATTSGTYAPGQEGRFEIALTPRGEFHVNAQYPMTITLAGPGEVAFPQAEITRDQAAEYGEPRARFQVPFTASAAGQHRVTAQVDFAVCTPESCMPDCRTLAVVLPVEAGAAAPAGTEAAAPAGGAAAEGATATQ